MTPDHEQMVLEAAAEILRSRGETALAAKLAKPSVTKKRDFVLPEDASLLRVRLLDRIRATGKTARSLSLELSMSPDAVRAIINGRSKDPGATTLFAIADALGCDPRWLLGLEGKL